MSPRRETWLVAALAVVPLLPFLGAAVSIDAPVFLAVARQVLAHPADPYGFDMIWDPTSPHAALFDQNPPALSYWLAPWIAVFGEWEPALHAALLPFPLLAALSFLGIARRSVGAGLAPAALLATTPAFLVLASTLMLDVPMLACLLFAVYALLRSREAPSPGWELAAGAGAAVAGLVKYPGLASAPLLAAGLALLPAPAGRPRRASALRALGLPLLAWGLWGAYTAQRYGVPHFAGGLRLVGDRSFHPAAFWNHLASVPIWIGGALVLPVLGWLTSLARGRRGAELGVVGLVAGAAVAYGVLPGGEPARRVPLQTQHAVIAALSFAGAVWLLGLTLDPRRLRASGLDAFLGLWLAGFVCFSAFVNWHVNAADALLAAPPAILLLFRAARPTPRAVATWTALAFALSLSLVVADVAQRDVYRSAARRIAREIGTQPGHRWLVGHWGFQYYLGRIGFEPVVPPQYERSYGPSPIAKGDWVASARNVSQLDVGRRMSLYGLAGVGHWTETTRWPLRATNPDAGAGFYSHQAGYVPFAFSRAPLEEIGLARVVSVRAGAAAPVAPTPLGPPR